MKLLLALFLSLAPLASANDVIPSPTDPAGKWEVSDCKTAESEGPRGFGKLHVDGIFLNYGQTEEDHPWHTWHKRTVSGELQLRLERGGKMVFQGTAFVKGIFDVRPQGSLVSGESYYPDIGGASSANGFSLRFPSIRSNEVFHEITVSFGSFRNRFAAHCRFKRVAGVPVADADMSYRLPRPVTFKLKEYTVAIEVLYFDIRLAPTSPDKPFTLDRFYLRLGYPSPTSITDRGVRPMMGADERGKFLRMRTAIGPAGDIRVYLDSGELWVFLEDQGVLIGKTQQRSHHR